MQLPERDGWLWSDPGWKQRIDLGDPVALGGEAGRRVILPEDAGMGAVPQKWAQAASLRRRSG